MEVIGKIKVIGFMKTNQAGTFSDRTLVVTTEEQYPQDIEIKFVQDKCDLLDLYKVGEAVKVDINLRGREWINPDITKNPTGSAQYFNTIQGWKIARLVAVQNAPAPAAAAQVKKYVHTATDATYEAYKSAQWTDQQLVDNGKGRFETAAATPPPAPATQQQVANFKEEEYDDLPF